MSVCQSVRHIPVFYGNGLTYCQFLHYTTLHPVILVLYISNIFTQLGRSHQFRGRCVVLYDFGHCLLLRRNNKYKYKYINTGGV